jgi:O-acetyl-ADP-ribose deacetylase (regulator of RNase III)
VRAGRAIVTSGGRLRQRYVIHGITLEFSRDRPTLPSRDLISEILASCVYQADSLYVERIAFPLLGTGTAGLPEAVCLDTSFRFLARLFARGLTGLKEARLVLFP